MKPMSDELLTDDYARAWWDWCLDLGTQPDRQLALMQSATMRALDTWTLAMQPGAAATAEREHSRFPNAAWNQWPFNVYARAYDNMADWWQEALVPGEAVDAATLQRLQFSLKQFMAAASPAHYLPTNPELIEQTRAESGANLLRGATYWLEDQQRTLQHTPRPGTEQFRVGETVAATPGKVVLQNELMELIQYSPATASVYAQPILITPAWIMKYYILDLSARNSLVRYLVAQGHTVFMISWKNPTANDRGFGMDDYVRLGLRAALDAVTRIVPDRKVHAVGYCIGGTLLSIGAAALAGEGDTRIGSISLFAAQTDFSEPGELAVFITPQQLSMLETMMRQKGVLESEQMGSAFAMMRASELIWAPAVNTYLRGQRESLNDLMAWNADGTRMPCQMHSEYLTRLYLHNELAGGSFTVDGKPVDLKTLTVPMFVVGTETDHVAPWRSVYKAGALVRSGDYTFLLTSGGHNAGIISGPSHPKRRHRTLLSTAPGAPPSADDFQQSAERHEGSWWPTWQRWIAAHSDNGQTAPPAMGNADAGYAPLRDAPGEYVQG
jgi:polyhydroxyalkanoate synthase